jgi:hypothetical protein
MEAASDHRWRVVCTLRNVTALALLTLCLGVLALWARSYGRSDVLDNRNKRLVSALGIISIAYDRPFNPRSGGKLWVQSTPTDNTVDRSQDFISRLYFFRLSRFPRVTKVAPPHWFIALVVVALAFALKPKPRLRFSLSDLLVLMTFAAVLVAGVAALTRLAA